MVMISIDVIFILIVIIVSSNSFFITKHVYFDNVNIERKIHTNVISMSTTEVKTTSKEVTQVSNQLRILLDQARSNPKTINSVIDKVNGMLNSKQIQSAKEVMYIINIFKTAKNMSKALKLLEYMKKNKIDTDTRIFNNLLDGCAKVEKNCDLSIVLFQLMNGLNIPRDLQTYGSFLNCFSQSGKWQKSLEYLDYMERVDNIKPDILCYTSVLFSCLKASQRSKAEEIFKKISSNNLLVDLRFYNTAIGACANEDMCLYSLEIYRMILSKNITPDNYTYSSIITALSSGNKLKEVLDIVDVMLNHPENNIDCVPFNIAISSLLHSFRVENAIDAYYKMKSKNILPSQYTYTTLITGLAKLSKYDIILSLFNDMLLQKVIGNVAIYGATMIACEKTGRWRLALLLLESMRKDNIQINTMMYNAAISVCGREGSFDMIKTLLSEMKQYKIPRSVTTYNLLIHACKKEGKWQFAVKYILDMIKDKNEDCDLSLMDTVQGFKSSSGISPNTVTYSTAISVLVDSKQWNLALELLEEMETTGIPKNIVTYNSVIEALDTAEETVRAELVYQLGLRSGIYQHWLDPANTSVMDLHTFPLSVAKASVIHTLGEIYTKNIFIDDRLEIITGRGNHMHSSGQRGVLRMELEKFIKSIGLDLQSPYSNADYTNTQAYPVLNPGRIAISKETIDDWLQLQIEDDFQRKKNGGAHGNLFLKVALAKNIKDIAIDVRAVCPFSSATMPNKAT